LVDRHKDRQAEHTPQGHIGGGLPRQPVAVERVGEGGSFEERQADCSPGSSEKCSGDGAAVITGGSLPRLVDGQLVQAKD